MVDDSKQGQQRGPDGLRAAIERTFAATAGSAVETRERAQELLDEVSRRGQEAREASASATTRLVEAIQQMRLVSREDLREVKDAVERLAKRVEALESARRAPNQQGEPDSKVEG